MFIRSIWQIGLVVALTHVGTATANAAAFTAGPATTCTLAGIGLAHSLVTPPTGPLSFSVMNNLFVMTAARAAPCVISWTAEQALAGPAGMWRNFSGLVGTADVPAGGLVNLIRAETDHSAEAGAGIATALVGPIGPGLGIAFAPPVVGGAVFMHGGGADTLRQEVRIEITPGAAGGLFGFHFPVDSATAPVPEPSMVVSVFLGLAAIAAWRSRKTN